MAKKKKQTRTRRKKVEEVPKESAFWPLAGAIIMMVIAFFLLLGGFGAGGSLPVGLFNWMYVIFGWAAYFTPVALIYWGVIKFTSEDRRIPLDKLVGMFSFLILSAAWVHVAFIPSGSTDLFAAGRGGVLGGVLGGAVLSAVNKIPSLILFFVFAMLAFFFAFGISPKVLLRIGDIFRTRADEENDLAKLKAEAAEHSFKLNENVPVEHPSEHATTKLSSFRNSAQKLTPTEAHQALTTTSDPDWKFPSIDLLSAKQDKANPGDVEANAKAIHESFSHFNINVEMEGANVGPTVTQYTLKPPAGTKLTKITALENNLALDLAAHSIRIEAPIPGKRAVGIEVPNIKSATVRISNLMQSPQWAEISSPLGFAIGKDIAGTPIVADLAKMPHLLVAGQTGSGKSVMINTILTSLLYRNSPSDLKLILVDPKTVEMAPYADIPHLLTPVITEPEKCISALKWAVAEMERRYRTLGEARKRNIDEYNSLKQEEGMPYIVIIIDELADLMMMAARDVEALIVRIAQKARAVGIHLILATQRPSVDVITGLIKANVPARIAFTTASQVDSRTIIDQIGAEKLLGRGDMLLLTADMPKPKRIQAALIEEGETNKITDFIREQRPPQYDDEVVSQPVQLNGKGGVVADYGANEADDDMWHDAVRVVIEGRKASTSLLQRRLRIGYSRAARIIETMEEQGIVGPADGSRPREVLVNSVDEVFNAGPGEVQADDEMYDENFPEEPAR